MKSKNFLNCFIKQGICIITTTIITAKLIDKQHHKIMNCICYLKAWLLLLKYVSLASVLKYGKAFSYKEITYV